VVAGEFKNGRYIACGLLLGVTYPFEMEIASTGAEKILLMFIHI